MSTAPPPLTPHQEAVIHQNKGPTLLAVSGLFIALSTIAVALRFVGKARRAGFGTDDYLALCALVFVILYCVTCILSVPYGVGEHAWATDPTQTWKIIRIGLFNALDYTILQWFIKMSILMFYKRLFTLNNRWFKMVFYFMVAYVTAWFIGVFFAALFQCYPPAFFWEQYNPALNPPPKGSCGVDNNQLAVSSSALNSVADVVLFIIPMTMLYSLQMRTRYKVAIMLIFATAAIAVAASFVRLSSTVDAVQPGADVTWITANIYLWTAVEAGVGLICACLPSMSPLYDTLKGPLTSFYQRLTSRNSSGIDKWSSSNKNDRSSSKNDESRDSGSRDVEMAGWKSGHTAQVR